MQCTCCKKPLTGGIDTFGDIQHPMCQECYLALASEKQEPLYILTIRVDEETGQVVHGIKWNESEVNFAV